MAASASSEFTMIFLDLDNTLIPTKMQKVLHAQLGIDLYSSFSSPLIKELQYTIISAIDKIIESIQPNQHLVIALVSNANNKWINQYIDYNYNAVGIQPKLPILSEYLKKKEIDLLSARSVSYIFLKEKLGKHKALEMIKMAAGGDVAEFRWMLKYLSFGAVVLQYKQKLDKSCNRIISFGDGDDEAKAMNSYSKEFNVECIHFNFMKSPTFEQLQEEWKYITDSFDKLIDTKNRKKESYFYQHDIGKLFEADNNKYFTGKSKQLTAVSSYIDLWMNECAVDIKHQNVTTLCCSLRARLLKQKKSKHLKKMVKYLMDHNDEFHGAWFKSTIII